MILYHNYARTANMKFNLNFIISSTVNIDKVMFLLLLSPVFSSGIYERYVRCWVEYNDLISRFFYNYHNQHVYQ